MTMIQFKEDEVCKLVRAITYYRDKVTGSDEIWDRYDALLTKIYAYGEEASTTNLDCNATN